MSSPDEAGDRAMLLRRWLETEIGRLMQQAEHWAANKHPLAVHYRLNKADTYFQIIALLDRGGFAEMARELASPVTTKPPGAYPPSDDLARYRDAEFAVSQLRLTGAEDAGVRALVEAIEPFAALARERYPEEGDAPSFIDIMTDAGMSDELELRTNTGPSDHTELLYGVDFRRAAAAVKPFRRT